MKIKMIVTDLDGTLLRTDKSISDKTTYVLRRLREAGIKIVYATGRGGSAEKVVPNELFDGKISMNGATAKIGNEIVYSRLIPYDIARPILTACDKKGIKITSEIHGMHYSNFHVTDFWAHVAKYKITDFSTHAIDAEKLYAPNPNESERLFIEQLLPDALYAVSTADITGDLFQVMHKDAAKAKAAAALARIWGIPQNEIAAFGDDLNDRDLLAYAGFGVATQNALDDVKAVSDFICASNDDDGVAAWIEKNVNIPIDI